VIYEMRRIGWPTRDTVVRNAAVTLLAVGGTSGALAALDLIAAKTVSGLLP